LIVAERRLPVELPTTKTPPTTKDPRVLILYGLPKVGKTTELAKLPDCLIIDVEEGTDFINSLSIKIRSIEELHEVANLLKKHLVETGKPKYKYVAIDTISTLEDWCEKTATQKYKSSTIGKNFDEDSVLTLPKGGGYFYLRQAFQEALGLFSGTTSRLILTAHVREKMLDATAVGAKQGIEASYTDLELTGKIRSIVCAKADGIGYMFRDKAGQLKVSFMTLEGVLCGSRCEHLKGKSFDFDWGKIYSEGI
jgi:hypothetical protein